MMNPQTLKLSAATTAAAILFTGCAGMTPGETGAATGVSAGLLAGGIGAAAGMNPGAAAALGAGVGLAAGVIAYVVAKHQADERQRQIAEANARRQYAARQAALKKQNARYIAVRTSRNSQSTGAASVMIWDTQSQKLVGDTVYDVKQTPQAGTTAKFDSYNAVYVGS
jgi:hypothetical protein